MKVWTWGRLRGVYQTWLVLGVAIAAGVIAWWRDIGPSESPVMDGIVAGVATLILASLVVGIASGGSWAG